MIKLRVKVNLTLRIVKMLKSSTILPSINLAYIIGFSTFLISCEVSKKDTDLGRMAVEYKNLGPVLNQTGILEIDLAIDFKNTGTTNTYLGVSDLGTARFLLISKDTQSALKLRADSDSTPVNYDSLKNDHHFTYPKQDGTTENTAIRVYKKGKKLILTLKMDFNNKKVTAYINNYELEGELSNGLLTATTMNLFLAAENYNNTEVKRRSLNTTTHFKSYPERTEIQRKADVNVLINTFMGGIVSDSFITLEGDLSFGGSSFTELNNGLINKHVLSTEDPADKPTIDSSLARSGSKSIKSKIVNGTSSKHRSEFVVAPNQRAHDIHHLKFSIYLDNSFANITDWLIIHQMHQLSGGNPPFAFSLQTDRKLKIGYRNDTNHSHSDGPTHQAYLSISPLPLGEWIDFETEVKFGYNNDGYIKVRQNGVELVNLTGINLGKTFIKNEDSTITNLSEEERKVAIKLGIYEGSSNPDGHTANYDDIEYIRMLP